MPCLEQRLCRELPELLRSLKKVPGRYRICRFSWRCVRSYQQGWAFMQISDIDKATSFFDKPLSQ